MKAHNEAINSELTITSLPQQDEEPCKMQAHWLLAKMGKRVLRPGGVELTQKMLDGLRISSGDRVVEFAPGLGVTAKMILAKQPARYAAIEREESAARLVHSYLHGGNQSCRIGLAEDTGLEDASATVVYGEAMLTMHTDAKKREIMHEAARILRPGGRYGIHEIAIIPDEVDEGLKKQIKKELSSAIHVGASPATISEWLAMLQEEGLKVEQTMLEPFHLLEPKRLVQDEGFLGASRFLCNLMRHGDARKVVLHMKKVFRKHRANLSGVVIIAVKEGAV